VTIRGPLAIILGIVLLASLATNLLIAGFVGARLFGPPRPGGEIERIVAIGVQAFPPEIRDVIEQDARAQRDQMKSLFDAARDARRKMFEAMRADPFDPAALDAAYADVRAKTNALQEAGQKIVLDAIAKAPADVRQHIGPPRGPFP
jgi:uncharacterized membrane protein